MKNIKKIIILAIISSTNFAFASFKAPLLSDNENSQLSYAIGYEMGKAFEDNNIYVNINDFTKGVEEGLSNTETPYLSQEKVAAILKNFRNKTILESQRILKNRAKENLRQGKTFLRKNSEEPGIITLDNGMEYKILESGTSDTKPKISSRVVVSYAGYHLDGKVFDQSQKSTFKVANVIAGWQQILPMMKVGDHWKIYVPSHLAYGPEGAPDIIGPNETIAYDIHLLKVLN